MMGKCSLCTCLKAADVIPGRQCYHPGGHTCKCRSGNIRCSAPGSGGGPLRRANDWCVSGYYTWSQGSADYCILQLPCTMQNYCVKPDIIPSHTLFVCRRADKT